ncbi:MAG TPA: DUF3999 family protein [Gemmataceae bacterium]|nr:DUF3999 family protein [Gemmataceae bacterium]
MRRLSTTALVLAGALAALAAAPAPGTESLPAWEWYAEVAAPAGNRPLADFVLPPPVFDGARPDLADLRLYDGRRHEVPYALHVRRKEDVRQPLAAKEFNRTTNPDRSAEVSLDLGESAGEHNEIEVATPGSDFRRPLRVEGSDDRMSWSTVLDKVHLIHFAEGGQVLDIRRFTYTPSRFRYLRVRVSPDPAAANDAPAVGSVVVFHEVHQAGDYRTWPAFVEARQPVPAYEGPGSAWFIRLSENGEAAPCESLTLEVADTEFVRPYRLEVANPDEPAQVVGSGELRRQATDPNKPLVISFPEVTARRLRLVVTDQRNPPLSLTGAQYTAAARQVIFRPDDVQGTLRLYFGNPKAPPPGYDFARTLPAALDPAPAETTLGPRQKNPDYQPPPKPWTERYPWAVYVVLGAASAVLLVLLGLLGREAIARHGAAAEPPVPG